MSSGKLYVVATPIGNLQDFTFRAREVLQEVDLILAEDTRHTAKLLNHYAITGPVQSFHEHNEQQKLGGILERLRAGESVALVSDAGTPLISDPGFILVRAVLAEGIRVIPIPGAAALTTALSAAGLPTRRFVFEGFLPVKPAARRSRIAELAAEKRTLVFYEVPHRILDTVADLVDLLGAERPVTLARELTKQFETIRQDDLGGLQRWLMETEDNRRGEIVLLLGGNRDAGNSEEETQRVLQILLQKLSVRDASNMAAAILGENRNRLYRKALSLKKDTDGEPP